ncbi:MAG TPA: class I SAM-dependent methyltransferase [Phycisphaerae bacterium]|nr:class I SAM-dependent methyltransferase [Phycisphaerae bacterium]HRY67962.1 class I SAM-dependent methyltransferase [Phycisphaerae bacterium]HSA26699.1 class I SAM-dependent methyltransferase [Phycisphaerae bacterium]
MADTLKDSVFEERSDLYDALIDWPKRLAYEAPFYRRWFERVGARRVLDAACGTGRHAALFHSWGLEVEGADLSGGMIAYCRRTHGQPTGLSWTVRSFAERGPVGRFDVAVCAGNSLPLADDREVMERAVAALVASVRPGGICIIHVLNLWRFAEGPTTWQKSMRVRDDHGDRILLKGLHRVGARAFIDFGELRLEADGRMVSRFDVSSFAGLEAEDLAAMADQSGASPLYRFGSYEETSYQRETSPDLILVAENRG